MSLPFAIFLATLTGLTACNRPQSGASAKVEVAVPDERFVADANDAHISYMVRVALVSTPEIDGMNIEVSTRHGRVTLSGTVPSSQIRRAEEIARQVEGVRGVYNKLKPKGILV